VSGLEFVRVSSRRDAERWHAVEALCCATDYVDFPANPVDEAYALVETNRTDKRCELWLGNCDGQPVAIGLLELPMLDNLDNVAVQLNVHPAFRRRGFGRAMLDQLTARVRGHGRTRMIGDVCEPLADQLPADAAVRSPGQAFAAALGARAVTTEIRRVLRVAELDEPALTRLHAEAVRASAGYRVLQWEGPAPEELLADLAHLEARMTTDAPLEDLDWEPEVWTPQRYREQELSVAASGQRRLVTVARHDATGRIVAFTDLVVNGTAPEIGHQWATIVLAEHRGHRLGMLIKLANLRYLLATEPAVRLVSTCNAAVNDHMVSINEAIGFRRAEQWREWQLEIGR
jgi:GNAT superfamily N-acetyltransferase